MESPRRRRVEGAARVSFLGTLPEEEWEVHHRDHENRTGCIMDRAAFMEEVWTVVQSYGTQSIWKLGLNRPKMQEVPGKLASVRDLMTQKGAAVACAKRRDALCFVRFMIEQV